MSTETPVQTTPASTPNASLVTGLAMVGGLGITLVMIGFLLGVFDRTLNGNVVGSLVLGGLLFVIGASVAWAAVVRPFDHFDDINVPQYHGHAHDDHDHDSETEGEVNATAAIPTDHADKAAHAAPADRVRVYPAPNTTH